MFPKASGALRHASPSSHGLLSRVSPAENHWRIPSQLPMPWKKNFFFLILQRKNRAQVLPFVLCSAQSQGRFLSRSSFSQRWGRRADRQAAGTRRREVVTGSPTRLGCVSRSWAEFTVGFPERALHLHRPTPSPGARPPPPQPRASARDPLAFLEGGVQMTRSE